MPRCDHSHLRLIAYATNRVMNADPADKRTIKDEIYLRINVHIMVVLTCLIVTIHYR